jgi:hypothetical protein
MNTPNPYESPRDATAAFTVQQRRFLLGLAAFRNEQSAVRLFLSEWRLLIGYFLLATIIVLPTLILGLPAVFTFLAGSFALGAFSAATGTLIGNCLARKRVWPVLEQIIDWERAETLVVIISSSSVAVPTNQPSANTVEESSNAE